MARENSFVFFGELAEAPIVFQNDKTKKFRVSLSIKTLRRNGRTDYPRVSAYGLSEKQAREFVKDLKVGAFLICRGMVTTRMVDKPIKCSKCGAVSKISTLFTEVITYGKPYVLKEKVDPTQITEFANFGMLLGTLCTDVKRRDAVDGPDSAQFQMAVGRRYRVEELADDPMTDFPWVKCFGPIAKSCIKRAQKSSQICLTGAFQTRDVQRNVRCDGCGAQLVTLEREGEIVPNGVEFLDHCLFDEKPPKNSERKEAVVNEEA